MSNQLAGSDLLAMSDLDKEGIILVLSQAEELEESAHRVVGDRALAGRILAPLFYDPAPWARASFESAMLRLGGQVLSAQGLVDPPLPEGAPALSEAASAASAHADLIVQRHADVYSAHEAAKGATVPLINGGDGTHEDPVQALTDLYTLVKERDGIDGLSIAMVGDLRHNPASHSLVRGLAHWDVELNLVAPPSLKMATVITVPLKRTIPVTETEDLASALETCDVLYLAQGRASVADQYGLERLQLDEAVDGRSGREITLMCSQPTDKAAAHGLENFFDVATQRQVANGIRVRMAVLSLLLA